MKHKSTQSDVSDIIDSLDVGGDFDSVEADAPPTAKQPGKPARKTAREKSGLAGSKLTLRTRRTRNTCLDLRKVKAAASQIGRLPDESEAIHCILGGDFNGFDLIPAMLDLSGAPFAALYITTLGFNLANNAQLCDLIDRGAIRSATVLCSEYFASHDPQLYAESQRNLAARGHRIRAARNHSKLILAQTAASLPANATVHPRYFVAESSANLRTCNNLEQLTLIQSRDVYEFHAAWIEEVFRQ